jgi:hypothetical protein
VKFAAFLSCLAWLPAFLCAQQQGLDGATMELRRVDGQVQQYRLVALQNPQNEPTEPAEPPASPNPPPPADDGNAQNEPTAPDVGAIKITHAAICAPAAVHVHALEIPLASGTPLTARYEWDFGDPDGRFNALVGFNAAHIYDKPGKYRVTLKLTEESGRVRTFATDVNIPGDHRRTVYADAGNFTAALTLLADDTRLLLKRGDRFDLGSTITIDASNVVIGAFGEGADPVLVWTGRESAVAITTSRESRDVVLENLTFDCLGSNLPMAIRPQGQNITVRNCRFAKVDYAINTNAKPAGVLVLDNTVPETDSLRQYFSWVAGSDHVYLGNVVANTLKQHVLRMSQFERVLVSHNDFTSHAAGGITVQKGKFVYVAHNRVHDADIALGPLGGPDGIAQDPDAANVRTAWAVVEYNHTIDDGINASSGAQHAMIRNNVVERDGNTAFDIGGWDSLYQRGIEDITIIDNTAINRRRTGKFMKILGQSSRDGTPQVTVRNNTYIAPALEPGASATAVVYVVGDEISECFRDIGGNVWPKVNGLPYADGGCHYVWPKWSDSKGYRTPDEWTALGAAGDRYENLPWVSEDNGPSGEQ